MPYFSKQIEIFILEQISDRKDYKMLKQHFYMVFLKFVRLPWVASQKKFKMRKKSKFRKFQDIFQAQEIVKFCRALIIRSCFWVIFSRSFLSSNLSRRSKNVSPLVISMCFSKMLSFQKSSETSAFDFYPTGLPCNITKLY